MDRRAFIGSLAGGLLAAPLAPQAQEAKAYRIGYLSSANPRSAAFFQAFEQRLRELGYIEGRNFAIEFRNAEGQLDRLPGPVARTVDQGRTAPRGAALRRRWAEVKDDITTCDPFHSLGPPSIDVEKEAIREVRIRADQSSA